MITAIDSFRLLQVVDIKLNMICVSNDEKHCLCKLFIVQKFLISSENCM